MGSREKIIEYIKENTQASPEELTHVVDISKRAIFKQLKTLCEEGTLERVGKPPKVYYKLATVSEIDVDSDIPDELVKVIEDNFLTITPDGRYLSGIEGFISWCKKRNFDIKQKAEEYQKIHEKYSAFRVNGLINGLAKFEKTFDEVFIDEVYYLDFYSIEVFGKTKLGQMLLYAKQSQDKNMIKNLVHEISPKIHALIDSKKIDGVGFIPPTVKRQTQFMSVLENQLAIPVRKLNIVKAKTEVIVPQKTLNKLEDRIVNASNTLILDEKRKFTNVLLLDAAVGSGATLNEVARMIKKRGLVSGKIIGLAITGSLKGFDIISEI